MKKWLVLGAFAVVIFLGGVWSGAVVAKRYGEEIKRALIAAQARFNMARGVQLNCPFSANLLAANGGGAER